MTNADIFETMEKEMKQIMELFAKERKSRKKELTKLQAQVDQKNQQIDTLNKEKEEIMQRWQEDSEQHKQFYDFMHQKVQQAEAQAKKYKDRSLQFQQMIDQSEL